jgi:GDP-D-mannose dehydratase
VARLAPNVELVVDPSLLRPVELPVSRGSYDKLHQATGWAPLIPLHVSLDDIVEDLIERRREP